jgi:hypothetical protein
MEQISPERAGANAVLWLDMIGETTVGSQFGFMEEGGDKAGILTALDKGLTHATKFGLFLELHWYLVKVSKSLSI